MPSFCENMDTLDIMQQTGIHFEAGSRIIFPNRHLHALYAHCRRKLAEKYRADESRERKAFGLIAGFKTDLDLTVAQCLPLLKNARQMPPYKEFMDQVMVRHAVPSETPFSKRGWVADPEELLKIISGTKQAGLLLLGSYHMHRVAWPDDPLRDTPTTLDTVLGAQSSMLTFIISMIKSEEPLIRAFYEGNPDREIPIIIRDFAK